MITLADLAQGTRLVAASVLIETQQRTDEVVEGVRPIAGRAGWHTQQINLQKLEGLEEAARRRREALLELLEDHARVCPLAKAADRARENARAKANASLNVCIGRAKRNDVVVEDPTVSSLHATFDWSERQSLRDQSSSNGTFVNGYRLGKSEEVPLESGDCVRFGQRVFYYLTRDDLVTLLQDR